MGMGFAPQRLTPSTLVAGALSNMTTRHGTPSLCAAYAQACAALPALTVMRPLASLSLGIASAAAKKPLTLKLPVGWRHSSLSDAPSAGTSGARSTCALGDSGVGDDPSGVHDHC